MTYTEPPKNKVATLIAEGDFVTAIGDITVKDEDGQEIHSSYCDVWRLRDGKFAQLRSVVIETKGESDTSSQS